MKPGNSWPRIWVTQLSKPRFVKLTTWVSIIHRILRISSDAHMLKLPLWGMRTLLQEATLNLSITSRAAHLNLLLLVRTKGSQWTPLSSFSTMTSVYYERKFPPAQAWLQSTENPATGSLYKGFVFLWIGVSRHRCVVGGPAYVLLYISMHKALPLSGRLTSGLD